jgi:hypothetical protein
LKKQWIPGQARNDENSNMRSFANYGTASFAGMTFSRDFRLFTSKSKSDTQQINVGSITGVLTAKRVWFLMRGHTKVV